MCKQWALMRDSLNVVVVGFKCSRCAEGERCREVKKRVELGCDVMVKLQVECFGKFWH